MSSSGTFESGERLRLFCALTLPKAVLDGLVSWQASVLPARERIVPPANLHVTVAFLGSRPTGDAARIGVELEAAASSCGPIRFGVRTYRETRSVGMVVLDDADGHAGRFALDLF